MPRFVRQRHLSERDVRTRRERGAFELRHGRRFTRKEGCLAAAAAHPRKRDVGEERARVSVRGVAGERAIPAEELDRPIHVFENHVLVPDIVHAPCGVGSALDARSEEFEGREVKTYINNIIAEKTCAIQGG